MNRKTDLDPPFLRPLLWVIAWVQVALGLGTAFFPSAFFQFMGFSPMPTDTQYLFGMLASRFLVLGVAFFLIAKRPGSNRFLLKLMFWIQVLDLLAGLVYTSIGFVPLGVSAFPMCNATLFAFLLRLWMPAPGKELIQGGS